MPLFSLVIATINRTEHHLKLLASLKEQTCRDFEIIVVDQNSHDRLKDNLLVQLSSFDLVYLHVKKSMGLSAARNYGLKHASGRIVGFPDDDCWYRKDTLETVRSRFLDNPALQGLTGLVTDEKGRYSAGGFMLRKHSLPVSRHNAWMTTNSSGIFLRKSAVNYVGNFDEHVGLGSRRFISGEETDLVLRIIELGFPVFYDSRVNIYHEVYEGKFNRSECCRRYGYGLGMGFVLRKNGYNLLQLGFYAALHFAKGSFMLLRCKPCRAWSHYCQGWGRIRGWFEYSRYADQYAVYVSEVSNAVHSKAAIG